MSYSEKIENVRCLLKYNIKYIVKLQYSRLENM